MSRENARAIAEQLIAGFNEKDQGAIGSLYAEEVTLWSSLGETREGRESVLAHLGDLFRRMPDEKMTADILITDGDTVVMELTSVGTSASGEPYRISFTEVVELSDGKVSSIKTYIDPDDLAAAET